MPIEITLKPDHVHFFTDTATFTVDGGCVVVKNQGKIIEGRV